MRCYFSYCSDKDAKTHDYDPDWDYDVAPLSHHMDFQLALHPIGIRLAQELASSNHPGFEVFIVRKEEFGDFVGMYINGTGSLPVIGLNAENIINVCKEENISLKEGIESTLVHELAHGIQDSMGLLEDAENDDLEDVAEMFARNYIESKKLDFDLLEFGSMASLTGLYNS